MVCQISQHTEFCVEILQCIHIIQCIQSLKPQDEEKRYQACFQLFVLLYLQPNIEGIIFSGEATFHTSGFVNKKTCIACGETKPDKVQELVRNSPKVNVWCAVCTKGIIGPYFNEGDSFNGLQYLDMLDNFFIHNLPIEQRLNGHFQQDGASSHYFLPVREFLDKHFKDR